MSPTHRPSASQTATFITALLLALALSPGTLLSAGA